MMDPSEDMAVRLTVANTIKQSVDDFEFRSDVFLEHIPRCFQLLYSLLQQSKECETKVVQCCHHVSESYQRSTNTISFQMQILNVLSFIIERVGWDIAPFFDSLVNYLPLLWQHSSDHNMLRCAIVSVLTQIVKVCLPLAHLHIHEHFQNNTPRFFAGPRRPMLHFRKIRHRSRQVQFRYETRRSRIPSRRWIILI